MGLKQNNKKATLLWLQSPHIGSQDVARELQAAVDGLVQQSGDPLTPGQMLFMGFNGLFVNLTLGSSSVVAALAALNTPVAWKNIDQLRDAKMLAVSCCTSNYQIELLKMLNVWYLYTKIMVSVPKLMVSIQSLCLFHINKGAFYFY